MPNASSSNPVEEECGSHPLAYSVADAVRVSALGRTTLYSLMRAGRLPYKKVLGRTVILRSDLHNLLITA